MRKVLTLICLMMLAVGCTSTPADEPDGEMAISPYGPEWECVENGEIRPCYPSEWYGEPETYLVIEVSFTDLQTSDVLTCTLSATAPGEWYFYDAAGETEVLVRVFEVAVEEWIYVPGEE